jgi:hypothetical protein
MNTTVATPRDTVDERPAPPPERPEPTRPGAIRSTAAVAALVSALVAILISLPAAYLITIRVAARQTQAPLMAQSSGGSNGSAAAIVRAISP